MNRKLELESLKQQLISKKIKPEIAEQICSNIDREIEQVISAIYDECMAEIYNIAEAYEIPELSNAVSLIETNDHYELGTSQTEFKEPPFPMLPSLLKNAKVSKKGTRYRVIPMNAKSSNKSVTIIEATRGINNSREELKNKKRAEKAAKRGKSSKSGEFRTATSEQDSSTQWINPGTTFDATQAIKDIEQRMQDRINTAIKNVIEENKREWL